MAILAEADQAGRYLFVVARSRPDLLVRAQERLGSHPHIEVIVDRRSADCRLDGVPGRLDERRSATRPALDGRLRPTMLVPRHRPTYAELEQHVEVLMREADVRREEHDRLRHEVQALNAALLAMTAAAAIRQTSHRLTQIAAYIDSGR